MPVAGTHETFLNKLTRTRQLNVAKTVVQLLRSSRSGSCIGGRVNGCRSFIWNRKAHEKSSFQIIYSGLFSLPFDEASKFAKIDAFITFDRIDAIILLCRTSKHRTCVRLKKKQTKSMLKGNFRFQMFIEAKRRIKPTSRVGWQWRRTNGLIFGVSEMECFCYDSLNHSIQVNQFKGKRKNTNR